MFSSPPHAGGLFSVLTAPRPPFAPTTPSPLRTSRNANAMSRPRDASLLGSSPLKAYGNHDENAPVITTTTTETPPPFVARPWHSAPPPASSTWEARARSASPAVTLARAGVAGRERKKSQFLERIRRRRDDDRSDAVGDQVARMDFIRERRQWETAMARRAREEAEQEESMMLDVDDGPAQEPEQEDQVELSPAEEREVEALVREFEARQMQQQHQHQHQQQQQEFEVEFGDDDDDYDEIFRELIASQAGDGGAFSREAGSGSNHGHVEHDEVNMDLS